MARSKSEFLSALGKMFEIWKRLVEAVQELGGSDDNFRPLLWDKELVKRVAAAIMGSNVILPKDYYYMAQIVGTLDGREVFREEVGPADILTMGEWLQQNGFSCVSSDSDINWVKDGNSYLYCGEISRSPMCDKVWAQVITLHGTGWVEVSDRSS
jgi:hypothetical protein